MGVVVRRVRIMKLFTIAADEPVVARATRQRQAVTRVVGKTASDPLLARHGVLLVMRIHPFAETCPVIRHHDVSRRHNDRHGRENLLRSTSTGRLMQFVPGRRIRVGQDYARQADSPCRSVEPGLSHAERIDAILALSGVISWVFALLRPLLLWRAARITS